MTRRFTPETQQIADGLMREAGNGLYSVIREAGTTCPVCATPPNPGYSRCQACEEQARSGLPLADRVGALVYALKPDSQVYKIVHGYKSPVNARTRLPTVMSALLALGLRTHIGCVRRIAGENEYGWAVVPSTRGRTALRDLVVGIGGRADTEVSVFFTGVHGERRLRPESWSIDPNAPLPPHVMVVDDSWVSGRHAQSVASMLKQNGVAQVSIFAAARVMEPSYGVNQTFISSRLRSEGFDWSRCPWTGGECPD